MLFEYSLNNLAFVRYSKMQLLLPLIPKMFLGFLGPQNLKNDKIYFRIIIRFIRYGHYPVTSLVYSSGGWSWILLICHHPFLSSPNVGFWQYYSAVPR